MNKEKNSGSSAQSSKTTVEKTMLKNDDDVVLFITILRKDRDWINTTKGELTREQRLHEIFENYKRSGLDAQYAEVQA